MDNKKFNILVCDDEKSIVDAIEIYLKQENYNILKAYNGEEALKVLENNEVHLVIMDIMMPKMDGLKAVVKIRETLNIPIIMLSAKSEDTDKIIGLNFGADDYITKPFNLLELIARVKSNLRRYMNFGNFNNETREDTDKILEKRKTEDREYLYNIKGKGRQYTGELTEKIKNNKIKISKYINGFLMEYRIYDNEIKDKNLVQIKRYYKSGNERLEVLYENGQIVQVKESYDKQGSENYKRITSYKNGKKDGKESFWDNDGRKIKN